MVGAESLVFAVYPLQTAAQICDPYKKPSFTLSRFCFPFPVLSSRRKRAYIVHTRFQSRRQLFCSNNGAPHIRERGRLVFCFLVLYLSLVHIHTLLLGSGPRAGDLGTAAGPALECGTFSELRRKLLVRDGSARGVD